MSACLERGERADLGKLGPRRQMPGTLDSGLWNSTHGGVAGAGCLRDADRGWLGCREISSLSSARVSDLIPWTRVIKQERGGMHASKSNETKIMMHDA